MGDNVVPSGEVHIMDSFFVSRDWRGFYMCSNSYVFDELLFQIIMCLMNLVCGQEGGKLKHGEG